MNFLAKGRKVFDIEIEMLQALRGRLHADFSKAVELMLETLKRKNKIIITGVGKSGHVGQKISATLTSTGAPSVLLDAVNAVHGDLGVVTKGDLLVILTYSGETEEIVRILPALRRSQNKIIALTSNPNSTVGKQADVHLDVSVEKEACPLNLAPTSSTTAMLVLGDALAMVLLEARGFKREDFAFFHPGGTIGRHLLLKVENVMRAITAVAVCRKSDLIHQVLSDMNSKRCGAAIVVEKSGKLAGIYTHGDFVRGYQQNRNIGSLPIGDFMTHNPICVHIDSLAVEVLNIFEKNRIEDLIVINKAGKPVGLIDVQDLTKVNIM
jgi:arabinose-5-phosphate isomerase